MKGKWALAIVMIAILICCERNIESPQPQTPAQSVQQVPKLSPQYESEIRTAIKNKGFPEPKSLQINEFGWLVATFELSDPISRTYLENFATETLLTIRNTIYSYSIVKNYRVTLDGPAPGPDLILRYGSARFIEGGSVEWEPFVK